MDGYQTMTNDNQQKMQGTIGYSLEYKLAGEATASQAF
jgi:hypothetical protein